MSKDYFVHETSIVDSPCEIGAGTKIWHFSHVMAGARIGEKCVLGQNVFVASDCTLGNNIHLQNNVSIYDGVHLRDNVFCGPSMVFTNVTNPRCGFPRRGEYRQTVVNEGASIGANATIVCGHNLGRYCFIGAGAVVTKDVPDFALILGAPGKIAGWMSRYGERLQFDSDNIARCPVTGDVYRKVDEMTVELLETNTDAVDCGTCRCASVAGSR